jgi:AraC-like DNA-binding protein
MTSVLDELRALAAHARNRRTETGIPRVAMVQGTVPEHELAAVYDPMINLILRGGKSMSIGGQTLRYDTATYFVMSIDLPAVGAVHPDKDGAPYLAISLTIDPLVVSSLLSDLPPPATAPGEAPGFSVAGVTPELLDAWVRMLRLMRQPRDIPALAPAYEREILYRVLQGPQGWLLRDIAVPDSALARIQKSIQLIRKRHAQALSVEELAEHSAMSVSSFHRRFKAVTAVSPLQFLKRVRLLQARQLLVATGCSATSAAMEVGYSSPTQFSREYAREFGLPPVKDVLRIQREQVGVRKGSQVDRALDETRRRSS